MQELPSNRSSRKDTTRDERLEVLRLLESGDISTSEADALLDALNLSELAGASTVDTFGAAGGRRVKNVRIRVSDVESGKAAINLALPLGLVEAGLNVARRFAPNKIPSAEEVRQVTSSGFTGTLLDVVDKTERIELIVE